MNIMPNIFKKALYIVVIAAVLVASFAALPAKAETPTITRIEVSAIGGSKATVTWSTNQATTGIVHYGLAAAAMPNFLGDSQLRQDHQVTLINLQESKTYYFNVTSRNAGNEETVSFTFTFATTKLTQPEYWSRWRTRAGETARLALDLMVSLTRVALILCPSTLVLGALR
jgi:hypothetical protein